MAAEVAVSAMDDIRAAAVQYRIRITPKLVLSILGPFFLDKIKEQVVAVAPISLFLLFFQVLVLRQPLTQAFEIALGLSVIVLGLVFFMEGLRLGLIPLGENIGSTLPRKAKMWLILAFAFFLGVAANYAEPAISTLREAGANVPPGDAPLLYDLLNRSGELLVLMISAGVGLATALGVYRFAYGWSLKVLLLPGLALCLLLTLLAELHPATRAIVALAWDAGGVTTGSVTVPLVLGLGLGVTAVLGKSDTGMSGFGIVTLASLCPIILVLLLAMGFVHSGYALSPEAAAALAAGEGATAAAREAPTYAQLIGDSMQAATQALVPLVAILLLTQRFVLREPIRQIDQIGLGLVVCLLGLGVFRLGLSLGLLPLGAQVGNNVPLALAPPVALYGDVGGRLAVLAFAFVMGYGATLAEPSMGALGITVEEVTAGAFKRTLLMQAVGIGVGVGMALGIAKVMFGLPIVYLLVPPYALLFALTLLSDEKYTNIGWDSAGVTTGDITSPLVLAIGLGVGTSTGAADGFGILALASVMPIVSVLVLGLVVSRKSARPPVEPARA